MDGEEYMERNRPPSVLDLFAAPGGLSQGFKEAGYQIVAMVDNDKWGIETLKNNFSRDGTTIIPTDVERLRIKGRVDIVVGGPPCQGFSLVGRPKIIHLRIHNNRKRFIDNRRNRLYKHFVQIVSVFRPQFFVMENVPGMTSFEGGRIKNQILEDFEAIGYETDVEIWNSADYGVPQVRKRCIFIGNRIGVDNPFPKRTHFSLLRPIQTKLEESEIELKPCRTVSDAISDLPPLEPGQGKDEMGYAAATALTPYQRWARKGSLKLYNHVARRHSERDRRLFRMLELGEKMINLPKSALAMIPYRTDIFSDKIKKQRWDMPSSAILAHMQKDGLMYVHPDRDQARSFTPREAARLQSFRDTFRFIGPMTQQFKQIGNAVPPLFARAIALAIRPYLKPLKRPTVQYEVLKSS